MAVIKNKRVLKCLLMIVVSLFLILNFSIGVSASTNYDRQEADTCITISQRLSVKGGSDTKHYLHRPYIRKGTIDGVNANTKVNYKTGQIYDSISGKWVDPSNVELGHKQGYEFWRMRDWAESQGMTQAEFNDFMNNPDFYGWQDISSNRSHAYEQH